MSKRRFLHNVDLDEVKDEEVLFCRHCEIEISANRRPELYEKVFDQGWTVHQPECVECGQIAIEDDALESWEELKQP